MNIEERGLVNECKFTMARSSGPGGQHVNKLSTKVILRFNIPESVILSDKEKEQIIEKLSHQLTNEQEIVMSAQNMRSQYQNKKEVIEKFNKLIEKALHRDKKRIATKPSRNSKKKRLEHKRFLSEKKDRRRKTDY